LGTAIAISVNRNAIAVNMKFMEHGSYSNLVKKIGATMLKLISTVICGMFIFVASANAAEAKPGSIDASCIFRSTTPVTKTLTLQANKVKNVTSYYTDELIAQVGDLGLYGEFSFSKKGSVLELKFARIKTKFKGGALRGEANLFAYYDTQLIIKNYQNGAKLFDLETWSAGDGLVPTQSMGHFIQCNFSNLKVK